MNVPPLPPRFINWRKDGDGNKIPCSFMGKKIDPHNPANHTTYEQASQSRYPVAYDVLAEDGWFFLDLDKCLQPDGQWSPQAQQIWTMFTGAWGEVSQSGTGLHILGRCDPTQLDGKKNKWDGWLEFYTHRRFIAFGDHGWAPIGGNATDADFTGTLATLVPDRPVYEVHEGVDPSYTGKFTDDELIERAMVSGGAAVQFGHKVGFKDLWRANTDVLGQHYPSFSDDQPFDHSSADLALMMHLAYWTGRDEERMDRLFRRSGLMRDKYELRDDYRMQTLQKAAAETSRVYDYKKPEERASVGRLEPVVDVVARAFVQTSLTGRRWIHDHTSGFDYSYDGKVWVRAEKEDLLQSIRDFCSANVDKTKSTFHKTATWKDIQTAIRIDPAIAKTTAELDRELTLLNTPAGTIDLITGHLRPHDPADLITQITAASPFPDQGTRFARFIGEITGGDEDLARYLQMIFGAALSGAVDDHWFAVIYGNGRNGKSELVEIVLAALGNYATSIPSAALMATRNPQNKDVFAQLHGKRLVVSSEVDASAHFDEAQIKNLTGDEFFYARALYKDTTMILRTFKIVIVGNHRPQLRSDDQAMRSRLKLVELNQDFSGDKADRTLKQQLRKELSAVMQWLFEGHRMWRAAGRLGSIAHVDERLDDYFSSQASVTAWLSERVGIVQDDGRPVNQWPQSSVLYQNYQDWCEEMGVSAVSTPRWHDDLRKAGLQKGKSNGYRIVGAELPQGPHTLRSIAN